MIPKIGLLVCGSNASNTGAITARVAMEIIRENKNIGILSLPALANKIPRQMALAKKIERLVVIDGCHNECAKKILDRLGIKYNAYINLENDLGIKKIGPFSTLLLSEEKIQRVKNAVEEILEGENAD